jgi:hypothetical protein
VAKANGDGGGDGRPEGRPLQSNQLGWAARLMTPLSKTISRNGPRNCRSLGFAPNEQNDFSISIRYWEGETADSSASPDFLLNLMALANFMRLSLLKGAHAALSSAAWQEIRVRSE